MKCRDNDKVFGCTYERVSVHAHCQSSTMIVHCFLYVYISIQLLLLSGDVETNPVTKIWPECSRLVYIRKTEGVSSFVGTRGHATTVNNEIVMNLFMNLFLVS